MEIRTEVRYTRLAVEMPPTQPFSYPNRSYVEVFGLRPLVFESVTK